MQHDEVLTELYKQSKRDDLSASQLYTLESALDSAVRSAARFEFDNAGAILVKTLIALQLFGNSTAAQRLLARCLTELGNIRRDQGHIVGMDGALALYEKAQAVWQLLEDHARWANTELCIGICYEMERNYTEALNRFKRGITATKRIGGPATLLGTLLLRMASLLTKIGALREAEAMLTESFHLLEENIPKMNLASARLKLAALQMYKGHFDKAHHIVEESIRIIGDEDRMRFTQAHILLANIMFNAGETDSGLEAASQAEIVANKFRLGHQLGSLNKVLEVQGILAVPRISVTEKMFDVWQDRKTLEVNEIFKGISASGLKKLSDEFGLAFESLSGGNTEEKLRSLITRLQLIDRFNELAAVAERYRDRDEHSS